MNKEFQLRNSNLALIRGLMQCSISCLRCYTRIDLILIMRFEKDPYCTTLSLLIFVAYDINTIDISYTVNSFNHHTSPKQVFRKGMIINFLPTLLTNLAKNYENLCKSRV